MKMPTPAVEPALAFHALEQQDGASGYQQRFGFTTPTPGLVVHQTTEECAASEAGKAGRWIVTHLLSGRMFPLCFDNRADATTFAERAALFGSWEIPWEQAQRRITPFVKRRLVADALDLHGEPHRVIVERVVRG